MPGRRVPWAKRRPVAGFRPPPRPGQRRRLDPAERHRRIEAAGQLWLRRLRRLALLAVVGAVAFGVWWLYQSPLLSITHVAVEGTRMLDPNEVAQMTGLKGQNILRVSTGRARQRLEAVPLVKKVSFKRQWPHGMLVIIEERRPWAFWEAQGRRHVIDDEGYVLERVLPDEGAPVIVNTDASASLEPGERVDADVVRLTQRLMDEAQQSLGMPVVYVEFRSEDGLTAVMEGGLRITFGDGRDFEYKMAALQALLERSTQEGESVEAVDLRFGARLSYR